MYVCMYENKHLHNKSQGTLSISCYTSCEGLGLAKTIKNVRNCKCRGKVAVWFIWGWSVCWCRDRRLFCSVLQRNQPTHNWHPCSSWIPVEGHTLRCHVGLRTPAFLCWWGRVVVSGSLVYPETAGQNRWSVIHVKACWPLFPPISQALGTAFFLPIPLKVLETLWKMTFTGSLCWCVFCNALWGGHSAWNVSDTYCTQSVCLLKTEEENLYTDASHLYLVHVCIWSLDTCVCPGVSLQLVTACESFSAEDPAAHKGSLSRVQSDMRPQQRSLSKGLFTACYVADVFSFPHLSWPAACKNQLHWVFHLKTAINLHRIEPKPVFCFTI